MKQTYKVFTLTQKRQAVRDMKALVAKGNSVSKARLLVGRTLDVTANTIYNWERKLTGTATRSVGLNADNVKHTHNNGITRPHITSVNLHVPGKGNITLDNQLLTQISRLAGFTS